MVLGSGKRATEERIIPALTAVPGSPVPVGTTPRGVRVDPTGRFAYVANAGANTVSAYTVNRVAGTLTAMAAQTPSRQVSGSASSRLRAGPKR